MENKSTKTLLYVSETGNKKPTMGPRGQDDWVASHSQEKSGSGSQSDTPTVGRLCGALKGEELSFCLVLLELGHHRA